MNDENKIECCICYEEVDNENTVKLDCKHTFCGICLYKLCNNEDKESNCPLCRRTIGVRANTVIDDFFNVPLSLLKAYIVGNTISVANIKLNRLGRYIERNDGSSGFSVHNYVDGKAFFGWNKYMKEQNYYSLNKLELSQFVDDMRRM